MELANLLQLTQTNALPKKAYGFWDEFIRGYIPSTGPLYDREMIAKELLKANASKKVQDALQGLFAAGAVTETDPNLRMLTDFLVYCFTQKRRIRWAYSFYDYKAIEPGMLGDDKDSYMLLLFYACMPYRMADLKQRGLPPDLFNDAMKGMFRQPLRAFRETGRWAFKDLPWNMNFMLMDLYFFGCLFFILERFSRPVAAFRNIQDPAQVKALYEGGHRIRRDGQPCGANGIKAGDDGFTTVWNETDEYIEGNFVAPMGYVEQEPVKLLKADWEQELAMDDWNLTIHMPGGNSYNLPSFKAACEKAMAMFDKVFPDYPTKSFTCDSWLFDGALQMLLPHDTSNIVKIMRQTYVIPQDTDDEMILQILFRNWDGPPFPPRSEFPQDTSLQRKALEYIDAGGNFHAQGMFLLRKDLPRFGEDIYFEQRYYDEFVRRYGV